VEADDGFALEREYEYYDPIYLLPPSGQEYWRSRVSTPLAEVG
jgi:lysine 2,3-aminomutase